MKFRKLLAGAAVAALTAGSASALDLTIADNGAGAMLPIGLANEGNNLPAADTVEQILQVTTDANIAAANNYLITVNVIGGSFGRNVVGTDLINQTVNFTGTNVQFDGSDRTGEEGDTSVRFLASNTTAGNTFQIRMPVKTDCAAPVTFNITLTTEAGTPVEEGFVTLRAGTAPTSPEINSIVCVEAYSASIASDEAVNDSIVTVASMFTAFDATVPGDTATVGTLGNVVVTFDPGMTLAMGGVLAGSDIYANLGDVGGAGPLAPVPTADAEYTLTTSSRAGIASLNGGAFSSATDTNTTIDTPLGAATTPITATLTGAMAVTQPTTVTASSATLNYTDAAQGLTDEPIILVNNGILDLINYEAGMCGNFDWVGDATLSRRNVWRVTGAPNARNFGTFASISNSSAGVVAQTRQLSPILTPSEILITDAVLTAAFGNFGRADFTFSFAGDLTGFDCDRLQTSPAAAIVTDFGNGTGNTPNGDGDD